MVLVVPKNMSQSCGPNLKTQKAQYKPEEQEEEGFGTWGSPLPATASPFSISGGSVKVIAPSATGSKRELGKCRQIAPKQGDKDKHIERKRRDRATRPKWRGEREREKKRERDREREGGRGREGGRELNPIGKPLLHIPKS